MQAFEPLPDHVKPASREDEARRAFFFTRELESRSWESVISNVAFFIPARAPNEPAPTTEFDQKRALKLMTWASIWCTAIECGGADMPPWLLDFFTTAMRIADDRQSEARSRRLLVEMGGLKDAPLKLRVTQGLASCGSGINTEDLGTLVSDFLDSSSRARHDLLRTALILPLEHVRELIQLIEHAGPNMDEEDSSEAGSESQQLDLSAEIAP